MITKCVRGIVILAIGLQLAGCFTDYGPVSTDPEPTPPTADLASHLQSGDKVKVLVYGEDSLSGVYEINPAGNIDMPLIGPVEATGRTKVELQQQITARYRSGKFLQEPRVTVDVVEYRPIYVMGEALRPGQYPYTSGLNVLTAISQAGGFTFRASKNNVLIQHAGESNWHEFPLSAAVLIAPGDLIRVPERYF
jgi:protein involved in polysaccharide export with SLBB domain